MPQPRFEVTDRVKHYSGETGQVADILGDRNTGFRYRVVRGPDDRGVTWPERALSNDESHHTMRKNGSPEENFIADLRSKLDIGDRFVNMRVPYPGSVFLQFYNVPTTHQTRSHGADQENNRIMLTFSGLNGPKAKVEATVLGPSFGGPAWKLRAKSGTPEKIADYAAEYLNRAAQKKPYGFTFDNYEKNGAGARPKFAVGDQVEDHTARGVAGVVRSVEPGSAQTGAFVYSVKLHDGPTRTFRESVLTQIGEGHSMHDRFATNGARSEPDETAARELSLYIENEYSLVGAPNSQGKAIEKNLLQKIRNGSFELAKSELAWMYLMEEGAKKYAKEFASPKDWSTMFNKSTRELVAHEFATTFYEENKGSR